MSLFEVPGWSVPAAPVPSGSNSRKRKRSTNEPESDAKVHAAAVNVDRLIAKLGEGNGQRPRKAKNNKGKGKVHEHATPDRKAKDFKSPEPAKKARKAEKSKERTDESRLTTPMASGSKGNWKNKNKKPQQQETNAASSVPPKPTASKKNVSPGKGLTALQATMKHSLDGARFRWINETLYKSDSEHARQMMRENPAVFSEYHTGFRHQVQSWPVNPVSHYISTLSKYPAKTVVADLGCGDAALAQALVPKGFTILSFDLVSDGAFVVEADVCTRIPLPGSETEESTDGTQVVDVVVCALSLMSVNWVGCIREAWRVLNERGELKIAEVASRFTEVEAFVSLVSAVGFRLKSKDDSNTHFTLFEFAKVKCKPKTDKEWGKLVERGSILKPCEYKRR